MIARTQALFLSFLLVACSPSKEQTLAACEMDAIKTYPSEPALFSLKREDFMVVCMRAKGFEITVHPSDCLVQANLDPATEAACYQRPR